MLTKKDLALLKGMFETYKKDTILEMRDETRGIVAAAIHAAITSSEKRLMAHMDVRFKEFHEKIVGDIGVIIDDAVLPQIADLQHEVIAIKRHVKLA